MPLPSFSNLLPVMGNMTALSQAADGGYTLTFTSGRGKFTFHGYEIPERLQFLGGEQMLAVHDFPGGIRTVQALGYFPAKIHFSGWIFPLATSASTPIGISNLVQIGSSSIVATVFDRMQSLKTICNVGTPVTLAYGGVNLVGFIASAHFQVYNQFRMRYTIEMVVTQDASQIQNNPQNVSQRQVLQQWADKVSTLQANPSMPYEIGNPLALFQDGLTSLLLNYNNAAAADFQNVMNLASSVSGAINPYITGSSSPTPTLQSLALQTNSAVTGITNSISALTAGSTLSTIQVANPNLWSIGSGVYGNALQAPLIAAANGLTDLQPLGQFNLALPAPPTNPPVT